MATDQELPSQSAPQSMRSPQQPKATFTVSQSMFQSPLPPADELERLEIITPGVTQELLRLTNDEIAHRRMLDLRQLQHIHNMERMQAMHAMIGLIFGFIIGLTAIGVTLWLGLTNHDGLAAAFGLADIAALVGVFVVGVNQRKNSDGADQQN